MHGDSLSQQRKSCIAKEFGYSETVFLHDSAGPGQPRRLDIFTEQGEEIPFAGHPVIGTAHYIFLWLERSVSYGQGPTPDRLMQQTSMLMTKAGPIPISYNPYRQIAACAVPHNYHLHSKEVGFRSVLKVQPHLQTIPTIKNFEDRSFPVVSIVKGMTFALIDLTDAPEAFATLGVSHAPEVELDQEWSPSFIGCMYYKRGKDTVGNESEPAIHNLKVRMITQKFEDPGTGSGNCALASYLALSVLGAKETETVGQTQPEPNTNGDVANQGQPEVTEVDDLAEKTEAMNIRGEERMDHYVFGVEQGVEMERRCQIAVEVAVKVAADGKRSLATIVLSGRANFLFEGKMIGG